MEEQAAVLLYRDDPDRLLFFAKRHTDHLIPPLNIKSIDFISDDDEDVPKPTPSEALEEILSDEEFQQTSISPRLIEYLATNQTTLDLSRCFLTSLKKYDTRWLAKFVTQCPALTSVSLKATNLNNIHIDVFTNLIIALRAIQNLTELIVSCNNLAGDAWRWKKWCDGIFSHQQLLRLNLANNKLYQCYAPQWAKLENAFACARKLKIVNLSYNDLGSLEGGRFKAFLQCLKQLPATCTINLSWNNLCALDASDWFIFLNFARKFYGRLILDNNGFSERKLSELSNVYYQRSFIGKTGGTLRSLVCQMIWRNPDKFDYDEDNKTLNNVILLDDVNNLLQSQSACRRC